MNCSESIKRRLVLARKVRESPRLQALTLLVCARDVVQWTNDWVWTHDPRGVPSMLPFDLFPKQEEFLRWMDEREAKEEDGIVEKSRDMGVTWLTCAFMMHRWLFRDGFTGSFGSRKMEYVDKIGDPKCIFEKLRFIFRNLPQWMLPDGFDERKHDKNSILINPANGSTLTGEGGDSIGRGGRSSVYVIDESAFLENPQRAESALSQNSRVKIHVSTPNGTGNHFYRMRSSGAYPVFTFRWQDDPRKDEAWYEEQKAKLDPVVLAQEVDIDYTASLEGIAIPAAWVVAGVNFNAWLWKNKGKFLPASDHVVAGLDIAEEGKNKNVMTFRRGCIVDWVTHWDQKNTTETAYHAMELAIARKAKRVFYDCVGVGAGVRGTFDTRPNLPFRPVAINGQQSPTWMRWPDGRSSKERFHNFRAEQWWRMRVRFEKTYEYREQGIDHPLEELISIPQNEMLIGQLSQPLLVTLDTGKIRLETKREMDKRGVASPDAADSLVMAFIEIPEIRGAL